MPRGTGPSRRSLHRHKKLAKLEGDQDDKNWSSSSSSTSDDDRADRLNLADSENDGEAVEQGDEARLHDEESDESGSDGEENDDSENDGEAVEQEDEARLHDEESDESGSGEEENDDADEVRQAPDVEDGDIRVLQDESDQEDDELNQEEDGSSSSSESSDSDESEVEESDEEENLSSEEDNEDEINEEANVGDVPLYPNARITLMESLVMLLTLSLRFSLTGECLLHILELIEMHCPVGNLCKTTLYKFKSYFVEIGRKALVLHYYCEHCMSALEGKNSVCERCGDRTILAFFIEIPLLSQLQKLFLREGFLQKLMYRFDRIKKHEGNFEDLYDGDLYKEQMENGFLSSRFNISFTWYSDGIQIFKSSKYCVWPLFFCINELSYKERTKKENILLCGLWFGKSKPRPNLFLNPFQTTFERFKNEGYHFNVPNSNVPILVKALLLFGTCDLQAKALFLRCKLYNAYHGCCNCYSRGQRFPAGRTTVHVHPYTEPRNVKLRKNKDVLKCARNARQTGRKHCLGIKGLSLLYFMMPDMIRGTGLDIMHMVFLGVCKLLSKFWFDSKFSNEPFSCSAMVDIINRRLSSIYPPSFVQRMTRNLTDLRLWKAKEFKLFFFYYSIPVLNGILPREYLVHHLKLVSALALLCQDSIFPEQVDRAGDMLLEYIRDFQRLYGLRYLGMNVHCLAHLAQAVRTFGPLWVLSCFFLEDLNGQLVKLIHAPYLPGIQICSSASLFMSLRSQIEKLHPHSIAKIFCLKLHQMFANYKVAEVINEKMCVTGKKAYQLGVPAEIIEFVRGQLNIENGHFMSFSTLRKRGIFFNSADRALRGKRCSQFACFDKDGVPILGKIRYFLRCSECNCLATCECLPALFLCVVDVYERSVWLPLEVQNVSIFHLFAVAPKNESLVLSCDQIKCVCFYMNFDGAEYLATPINSVEYE